MKERDWLAWAVAGVGVLIGLVMIIDASGAYLSQNYYSVQLANQSGQRWILTWIRLFTLRGVTAPSPLITNILFSLAGVWIVLSLLCLRWLRPLRWLLIGVAILSLWYVPIAWLMVAQIALVALTKLETERFPKAR